MTEQLSLDSTEKARLHSIPRPSEQWMAPAWGLLKNSQGDRVSLTTLTQEWSIFSPANSETNPRIGMIQV